MRPRDDELQVEEGDQGELSDGWVYSNEESDQDNQEPSPAKSKVTIKVEKDVKKAKREINMDVVLSKENREKFEKFLVDNPKLVNCSHPDDDDEDRDAEITEEDEIWTMQCPKDLEASALRGAALEALLLRAKKKVRIPATDLECVHFEQTDGRKIALTTGRRLQFHQVKGKIVVRRKMENAKAAEPPEPGPPTIVPFPENLKVRHPLFGADFKKTGKLSKVARRRLAEAAEVKEKKKSKRAAKIERSPDPEDAPPPPSKKIKIKKEPNWETETSIADSLFNVPIKKSKKK